MEKIVKKCKNGLNICRAQRTKSKGPKGLQLILLVIVRARRAPRLLVTLYIQHYTCPHIIPFITLYFLSYTFHYIICVPITATCRHSSLLLSLSYQLLSANRYSYNISPCHFDNTGTDIPLIFLLSVPARYSYIISPCFLDNIRPSIPLIFLLSSLQIINSNIFTSVALLPDIPPKFLV